MEEFTQTLQEWIFWAVVIAALGVWYVLARWIAHARFRGGAEPFGAARDGAIAASVLTPVAAGLLASLVRTPLIPSLTLAGATLILCGLVLAVLLVREPARAR